MRMYTPSSPRPRRSPVVAANLRQVESASNRVRGTSGKGVHVHKVTPCTRNCNGERPPRTENRIPGHVELWTFSETSSITAIVDESNRDKAGAVWMQLKLAHAEAAARACNAGLRVVMDRCMKIEHTRLHGKPEEREKTTSSV